MTQTIDAIYEDGAFKPVNPEKVLAANGQHVTLVIQAEALPEPLRLAARVYDGLSPDIVDEIEKIALDRTGFGERNAKK